jgi:thioredoxin 1
MTPINNLNFKTEVLDSQIPVLVDFWATWCEPCKALTPVLEALAEEYQGRLKVVSVNVEDPECGLIPHQCNIRCLPTLVVFKAGDICNRITGFQSRARIDIFLGTCNL